MSEVQGERQSAGPDAVPLHHGVDSSGFDLRSHRPPNSPRTGDACHRPRKGEHGDRPFLREAGSGTIAGFLMADADAEADREEPHRHSPCLHRIPRCPDAVPLLGVFSGLLTVGATARSRMIEWHRGEERADLYMRHVE
jgi:hypothetical protein